LLGGGATPASAQPVTRTPTTPAAGPRQETYPEVRAALEELSKTGNIPNAIKKYEEASRKYPELSSAHVWMYGVLARVNQPNLARLQLDEAVKTNPSDPEPYVILGDIALQDRRLSEAGIDFEKAKQLLATYNTTVIRKAAMEHDALSGMAGVAEAHENWKEAEQILRELLKLAPEDLVAHQRLARSLFLQGKAGDAYEVLRRAKEIDHANSRKNNTREIVLTPEAIMAKYYDELEGPTSKKPMIWFDAALKNAPKDLATRQVAATWALEKGNLPFAKEQADAILKIEAADRKYSGSNVGHMLRGLVYLWEKRWEDAEKDFNSILFQAPKDFGARNNLALALVEQQDPAKKRRARELVEANQSDYPNNPNGLSTLAWVYFRLNEFDLAGLTIQKCVGVLGEKADSDTRTYLAYILDHRDEKWQAKNILEGVLLKSDRPFAMKKEAQELYDKVKTAAKPEVAPAAKTP
jgi:Flp pilus assembly protein TadD